MSFKSVLKKAQRHPEHRRLLERVIKGYSIISEPHPGPEAEPVLSYIPPERPPNGINILLAENAAWHLLGSNARYHTKIHYTAPLYFDENDWIVSQHQSDIGPFIQLWKPYNFCQYILYDNIKKTSIFFPTIYYEIGQTPIIKVSLPDHEYAPKMDATTNTGKRCD